MHYSLSLCEWLIDYVVFVRYVYVNKDCFTYCTISNPSDQEKNRPKGTLKKDSLCYRTKTESISVSTIGLVTSSSEWNFWFLLVGQDKLLSYQLKIVRDFRWYLTQHALRFTEVLLIISFLALSIIKITTRVRVLSRAVSMDRGIIILRSKFRINQMSGGWMSLSRFKETQLDI